MTDSNLKSTGKTPVSRVHPTREEAEEAVRTLIRWSGDDPGREGLLDTPSRVVRSYAEFFAGYHQDPMEILKRTFSETHGYDEMVLLKDIEFQSHCEHHMVPIVGKAHVAYLPDSRVVGISKLARVVEAYAKRLQIQEKMTNQIAQAINGDLLRVGKVPRRPPHPPGIPRSDKVISSGGVARRIGLNRSGWYHALVAR